MPVDELPAMPVCDLKFPFVNAFSIISFVYDFNFSKEHFPHLLKRYIYGNYSLVIGVVWGSIDSMLF